jgi:hypothetical protein
MANLRLLRTGKDFLQERGKISFNRKRENLYMNKQIYGITLFVVIVSFSVFLYEYLSYTEELDCGKAMSARCVSGVEPFVNIPDDFGSYDGEDVTAGLDYIEASMRSQTVKARLDLDWQGAGDPPRTIWVQIRFHNFDGSNAGWASELVRISNPFENGGERTVETALSCGACNNLPRNLYASTSVWTGANTDKKLVYKIGDLTPVVVQEQR